MHLAGQARSVPSGEQGYAMAMLLVSLSVMAVMMTVAMPVWKHQMQRERETELIFRGQQYVRAIMLFQRKAGPGVLPPSIDVLVQQRLLRKKYKDPITGDDFQPIGAAQTRAIGTQPGQTTGGTAGPLTPAATRIGVTPAGAPPGGAAAGGIIGVVSKSTTKSIRLYNGRDHYNEWAFVYAPQTQAPGVAPGATAVPGVRPGQGGQPQPGGVVGPGGRGRGPGGFNPLQAPRRPGSRP